MMIRWVPATIPSDRPIFAAFVFHSFAVGTLFARIAEVQRYLDLSEDQFGLTLMGFTGGVFLGSTAISGLVDRVGPCRLILWIAPTFAASILPVGLVVNSLTLFAAMFGVGLALAVTNIAMNVEADRFEASTGQRIMNRCHGFWGVGYLASTSIASGLIALNVSLLVHFLGLFAVAVLVSLFVFRGMIDSPARVANKSTGKRLVAVPTLPIILILGFGISGMWLEGATRFWSVIYLRDVFNEPEWLSALSLTALIATQTLGRFLADDWIDHYGAVAVARTLSLVSLTGLVMVVFAGSTALVFVGLALIGLGISTVHPQSLSAAAQLGDRPAGENVAALSALQTLIVFAGPPVFGFVGSEFGLRAAFGVALPLPILALYFARYLAVSRSSYQ